MFGEYSHYSAWLLKVNFVIFSHAISIWLYAGTSVTDLVWCSFLVTPKAKVSGLCLKLKLDSLPKK
jgi:hypothetical protein